MSEPTPAPTPADAARFAALEARLAAQEARIDALQRALAALTPAPDDDDAAHALYAAFQERFRGTRATILERLRDYPAVLAAHGVTPERGPALDLGCGRGEWLETAAAAGWRARGVDASGAAVAGCVALGLAAEVGDALAALEAVPAASLGLVTAFHLIEHLDFTHRQRLFAALRRAVAPGGGVLLETPNPANLQVGAHTFHYDPTHTRPLPYEPTAFFLRAAGFPTVHVLPRYPTPPPWRLPGDGPLAERLNDLLCGPQDYALLGLTS